MVNGKKSRGIGSERCERCRKGAQDLHDVPMALATDRTPRAIHFRRRPISRRSRWRDRAKELPRAGEGGAPLPIGEEPEVPDAHEATRQHVQEKPAEEFVDAEGHDLGLPAI